MNEILNLVQELVETQNERAEHLQDEFVAEANEFDRWGEINESTDESIRFTEGGFERDGRFVPGQVCEVDTEAAEFDPELAELSNELNTWICQSEDMSCAVAGQTMAVNQLEKGFHSEQELIEIGEENNWYNDGTYASDVGKIAEYMGMEIEQIHEVPAEKLTLANDAETKVLATVDSTLLHYPESFKRCQPDHVVQVLRVENTPQGEVVILNDSGHENGRGAVYPMEVFAKAYSGDITTIRKGASA